MFRIFTRWINLISRRKQMDGATQPFDDIEFKRIMAEKSEQRRIAERIVGDTPFKHIDYIIQNGFEEFDRIYYNSRPKTLLRKESERDSVDETIPKNNAMLNITVQSSGFGELCVSRGDYFINAGKVNIVVRGGKRNKVLYQETTYIKKDAESHNPTLNKFNI